MGSGLMRFGESQTTSFPVGGARERTFERNVLLHFAMLATFLLLLSIISADIYTNILPKVKLALRMGTMLFLIVANLICIRRTDTSTVVINLFGFGIFFLFAFASVTWSPIPSHTMKQLFSLAMMLLLASTIAHLSNSDKHVEIVLFYLVVMLLLRSTMMVLFYLKYGEGAIARGTVGQLWHATDAADTAGLGLVLLFGSTFMLKFRWAKLLFIPGLFILMALLAASHNRFVLVITPLTMAGILLFSGNQRYLFWGAFLFSLLMPFLIVFDAHTGTLDKALGVTEMIADREDSSDLGIYDFSGRGELWPIVWEEFQKEKLFGHGYMVTSEQGEFFCWHQMANYDAHNQILHVMVSLGLIGLGFFVVALSIPFRLVLRNIFLVRQNQKKQFARLAMWVIIWMFMWGLLNVSFSGYINSSKLVFFGLLGLVIGRLTNSDSR